MRCRLRWIDTLQITKHKITFHCIIVNIVALKCCWHKNLDVIDIVRSTNESTSTRFIKY